MIGCACLLASFYTLVGLPSDNPEPTCSDIGARDEVDPSVEDLAFFVERAERQ